MSVPLFVEQELGLFARRISSGIFLCGRSLSEVLQNSGPPLALQPELSYDVDRARRRVSVTYKDRTRTAQFVDDQGSVVLPIDSDTIMFSPVSVASQLPAAEDVEWPMGDVAAKNSLRSGINQALVNDALDIAFDNPRNLTNAVVIVYKGKIVGERYLPGITKDTPLESWSMGKSLLATVFARLVLDGVYGLDDLVPVPEWRMPGDPRGHIRIRELLQMSSGLKFSSSSDKSYSVDDGYPDHLLGYCEAIDVHEFATSRKLEEPSLEWKGRYRNCDPWVIGWLIKNAVLGRGEDYLSYPQRSLFDRIGIRRLVMETDPYGNLIFTGCNFGTARNWARLGMLYLQDGVWENQRLLPEGWSEFVSTPAPAWQIPEYGGLFWLNQAGAFPMLPTDTYYAAGVGGQLTFIIPKHDLVVVRMGYSNERSANFNLPTQSNSPNEPAESTNRMLERLMQAMPQT